MGNLNKLELQLLVFEDVIDDQQESKVKEWEYDTSRCLQFSITFTINGNYLHLFRYDWSSQIGGLNNKMNLVFIPKPHRGQMK